MKTKTLTLKEQKQQRAEIVFLKGVIEWYSYMENLTEEQTKSCEGFKERLEILKNTQNANRL